MKNKQDIKLVLVWFKGEPQVWTWGECLEIACNLRYRA